MRIHNTLQILVFVGLTFSNLSQAFILYDWNLKHLGRVRFSTKNVASVISDGDLVLIQEVNTTISGRTKLKELRDAVLAIEGNQKKTLCMGISKKPTGGIERYAMLWNEAELIQVDEKGKELPCDDQKFVELELTAEHAMEIVREPAYVLLKDKKSGRTLLAATVHALPKGNGKTPEKEIPLIFESVATEAARVFGKEYKEGVVILGGDFNMSVRNAPFKKGKDLGFEAALSSGPKTSLDSKDRELSMPYDNVFIKSVGKAANFEKANVINLYKKFEDLQQDTIYNTISDHCPLRVEIDLDPK